LELSQVPDLSAKTRPQATRTTILVVEDDPLVRHSIAEALRCVDVKVVEAGTADEAWDYLRVGTMPDLVFTDHGMPGSMTGSELAERIRRLYPFLKVIITSGNSTVLPRPEQVVAKPYSVLAIASYLAELALAGRRQSGWPDGD
jgi:CheY-like chemotaxis protein